MGTGGDHIEQTAVSRPIDEMVDGTGRIRTHWQALVGSISSLPNAVIHERIERIRRHLEENGITRRPSGNGGTPGVDAPTAPWEFDLLPVILTAQEWEMLAAGLKQRAQVIDATLRDLYGPQTLLRDGVYPSALVLGNRRFWRAARHSQKPDQPFLHVYAADLARDPDGQWRVVADRLDAPAGAGFVLENRLVLARALPEVFRTAPVRRLRPFYELWQQALQAIAPAHNDNPRMVLLTPGPFSETYVEHASLARELNLVLAEGADLTVRGDHVFLKTLSGLHPVDVLLRRVDSEYADPLELRPDSALGASGLLQAVRSHSLGLANALGCGVLETPALAAFLPALAQRFLGQDLQLPSLPTWWCGTQAQRQDGLSTLGGRLIRRAFPSSATEAIDTSTLSSAAQAELLAAIERRPNDYVIQAKPCPSTTPIWSNGKMAPRPLILRMFLVATANGYTVLPGGFARVGTEERFAGLEALSLAHGGISKDVWVLADAEGDTVVPAPPPAPPLILRRSAGELPSRVADNLYWLGRYAERADNAARLLRSCISRLAEGILGPRERTEVSILSALLSERGLLDRPVSEALADGSSLIGALARACSQGQSLDGLLVSVGRLLPGVRDRLSPDLLHVLGPRLDHARSKLPSQNLRDLDSVLDSLDSLIVVLAALGGMVSENMTRHAGWRFLDMGRKLERAQFTTGILRGLAMRTIPGPAEPGLRLALELCDSSITYRSRYRTVLQSPAVLDLVVADESNPRSLAHQLGRLIEHLSGLPSPDGQPAAHAASRLAHAAMAVIWALELELMNGNSSVVKRLNTDLLAVEGHLAGLNDAITRTFFSHIKAIQAFGYGSEDTSTAAQGFAP